MPYAANIAVDVAGVAVVPGDYIYADAAGAVVTPAASIDQVLAEARRVDDEDAAAVERIKSERPEDLPH